MDIEIGASVISEGDVVGKPIGEGFSVDSIAVGVDVGGLVSDTGARVVVPAEGALVGVIGASVAAGVSAVGKIVGESVALAVGELVGGVVEPNGHNSRIGGSNRVCKSLVSFVYIKKMCKIMNMSLTNEVHPALWPSTKTGYASQLLLNVIIYTLRRDWPSLLVPTMLT